MQLTPNATSPIGSHSPLRGWQCVALHNVEQLETPPTKLRCRPVRWTDHSTLQAVNTLHGVKSPNSSKSHPSHACNLHAVHSAVNWSGRALEFESVMNGALWLVEPRGDLQIVFINPRPAGGGGAFERPPPSGFSRIAKKRRRAAPPDFHPPYPPSFPQLLWKFRPNAMWGQVTRSGQVTQLQNNFPIAPRLQCFKESYETFGIWWGHQCLQNVYLGFLISVT